MRNITFAIYKGIEYSAGIKKDGRIVLRSEDDASKKEGFVEKEIGNNRIYIKYDLYMNEEFSDSFEFELEWRDL